MPIVNSQPLFCSNFANYQFVNRMIPASELIINPDGSIFHLHMKPEQLAGNVILVGDPGRVEIVSGFFDTVTHSSHDREFVRSTGTYKGQRFTVLSTGIGTDNIDIVMTELDALANIDFATREVKPQHRTLNIVRIGTSGSMQEHIALGNYVLSTVSVGFDNTLCFYAGRETAGLPGFEEAFIRHMQWGRKMPYPYFVKSSDKLNRLFKDFTIEGMTISASGFYGPQGRVVRLPLADPGMNAKITAFEHDGRVITNYEMESSALAGLAALLGHEATTVCYIIADRKAQTADSGYKQSETAGRHSINHLIESVLTRLTAL